MLNELLETQIRDALASGDEINLLAPDGTVFDRLDADVSRRMYTIAYKAGCTVEAVVSHFIDQVVTHGAEVQPS